MKSTTAASTLLLTGTALAQGPPGGWHGAPGGPFAAFPSCVDSCWSSLQSNSNCSPGDYSCYCSASTISTANACIAKSSCSDSQKSDVYQAIAQLCANTGSTVTASPEATFSVTSGGTSWPSGWTTATNWPSGGPWNGHGGPPGGWNPSEGGPFGPGGWGPWKSTGSWTAGPWTSWWGNECPPSTWSGWTSGSWATNAPWTSWAGCTASTTATSVATSTITANGTTVTTTVTGYGIKVAAATNAAASGSSTSSNAAAKATGNVMLAGSAVGAFGVLAGALLL